MEEPPESLILQGERVPTSRIGLIIDGDLGLWGDIIGDPRGVQRDPERGLAKVSFSKERSFRGVQNPVDDCGVHGSVF